MSPRDPERSILFRGLLLLLIVVGVYVMGRQSVGVPEGFIDALDSCRNHAP